MKLPVQLTFRHTDESEPIKRLILKETQNLEHYFQNIMGCRVLVEKPHRHHQKGNLFRVRINLTIPGKELVTGRSPRQNSSYEDVYTAIHTAFREVKRQLLDEVKILRRETKKHAERRFAPPPLPEFTGFDMTG